MRKRLTTKIGDIFEAGLDKESKKYFQYIANDSSQLNSSVIRAFTKSYAINEQPTLEEVIKGQVNFYAHVVLKFGVDMGLWQKVGNIKEVGDLNNILFRDTHDYGSGAKVVISPDGKRELVFKDTIGKKAEISDDWYVWKIGEEFKNVGKLELEYRKANIGLIFNPNGILKLLKGEKYPPSYPAY